MDYPSAETQKEQLEIIGRYSTNLQAVEKPQPKPSALYFEGHVAHPLVLSPVQHTLRQTVHGIHRMDIPNTSEY